MTNHDREETRYENHFSIIFEGFFSLFTSSSYEGMAETLRQVSFSLTEIWLIVVGGAIIIIGAPFLGFVSARRTQQLTYETSAVVRRKIGVRVEERELVKNGSSWLWLVVQLLRRRADSLAAAAQKKNPANRIKGEKKVAGVYISFPLVHCWFYSNSHKIDRRDVDWLFLRFRRRRRQRHNTPKFNNNNNKRKKFLFLLSTMTGFFLPTFMNDTVHRCGLYLDWRSWHSCQPWCRRKRKLSSLIRLRDDTAIWGIKPESL